MLTSLAPHVHRLKFLLNENSTTILTGVGIVGTVSTAVLAGRASFKAAAIIRDEEDERIAALTFPVVSPEPISKTEKAKMVWPYYIPPIAVGAATITSIVMAHRISSKRIAALAVASTISERALQEYKAKVVEKLGERQETAVREEIAQDSITKNPPSGQVIITGSGDVLCYDSLTGRYFNSTIEQIKAAENKVNYEIIHFDSCSLSTFYDEIGLRPTDYSDMVGWNVGNRMEVKFTTTMSEDNRPCLVIEFLKMPSMDYNKIWTGG
jgi:hypothetical protein